MSKHVTTDKPTDADLKGNPMIGGSKGQTMAKVPLGDIDEAEAENTFEGDLGNDTTPQGGVEKRDSTTRK
jgi:hypothetical protein